ncbi:MAG TPA: hypothetical protein DCM08_07775 [Microscillaceae bacterium]|jgi:hypothetical protein|nr:hypothetical protein [Microscillaceae bacterium]
MRTIYSLFLCLGLLTSCQDTPALQNFDAKLWQQDRLGCQGKREKLIESLANQADKLKGLGQNQIIELLGKPDLQELHKRNQKFYLYFYKKGTQCDGQMSYPKGQAISIRFNALDRANEIVIGQ